MTPACAMMAFPFMRPVIGHRFSASRVINSVLPFSSQAGLAALVRELSLYRCIVGYRIHQWSLTPLVPNVFQAAR